MGIRNFPPCPFSLHKVGMSNLRKYHQPDGGLNRRDRQGPSILSRVSLSQWIAKAEQSFAGGGNLGPRNGDRLAPSAPRKRSNSGRTAPNRKVEKCQSPLHEMLIEQLSSGAHHLKPPIIAVPSP